MSNNEYVSPIKDSAEIERDEEQKKNDHKVATAVSLGLGAVLFGSLIYVAANHATESSKRTDAFVKVEEDLVRADGMYGAQVYADQISEDEATISLHVDPNCTIANVYVDYVTDATKTPTDITNYWFANLRSGVSIEFKNHDDLVRVLGQQPCAALIGSGDSSHSR